jgi:hypothetical protein
MRDDFMRDVMIGTNTGLLRLADAMLEEGADEANP